MDNSRAEKRRVKSYQTAVELMSIAGLNVEEFKALCIVAQYAIQNSNDVSLKKGQRPGHALQGLEGHGLIEVNYSHICLTDAGIALLGIYDLPSKHLPTLDRDDPLFVLWREGG